MDNIISFPFYQGLSSYTKHERSLRQLNTEGNGLRASEALFFQKIPNADMPLHFMIMYGKLLVAQVHGQLIALVNSPETPKDMRRKLLMSYGKGVPGGQCLSCHNLERFYRVPFKVDHLAINSMTGIKQNYE